jgi:hypothetical protein
MQEVTLIGRYRVHKHRRRWIVTHNYSSHHGEGCISTHGSHATACAAAKRYDATDRRRQGEYRNLVRRFL